MYALISPYITNPAKDGIFDIPLFHHSIILSAGLTYRPRQNPFNFDML